jgi:hypothetical protein
LSSTYLRKKNSNKIAATAACKEKRLSKEEHGLLNLEDGNLRGFLCRLC